jgi:alkaline phosphatase D
MIARRRTVTRRALLAGSAAAVAAVRVKRARAFVGSPFTLGVASGNPGQDSVILWTRLAPEPLAPDPNRPGGMPPNPVAVRWEVALDDRLTRIVRHGEAVATPETAHALRIECAGLEPGHDYWYRFTAAGEASSIGRTRTAPARGAALDRLRFGFCSCANYEVGYFAAYRHLAEEHPDLVLFLGDYIYEYVSQSPQKVRAHSDGVEANDLRTYRNRYAQYRTDPDLQQLHAAAPCLMTWSDHEVQNDYADRWSQTFDDPQAFLARRAAAYRAYWEHMPLPPAAVPRGPNMPLYGRFDFGALASFFVLDARQYRSRLACDQAPKGGGKQITDAGCPEWLEPNRSNLGIAQETWLYDQFHGVPAKWNILAQEQLMAELKERLDNGEIAHWSEDWNGFPAARTRVLTQIRDTGRANPVVIGGDIHSFWANDLNVDFDDPQAPIVASEFIGSSITSAGPPYDRFVAWLADNPHVRFFDSRKRGYVSVDLQPQRMEVTFRAISDPADPGAEVTTLQRFVVADGKPGPIAV